MVAFVTFQINSAFLHTFAIYKSSSQTVISYITGSPTSFNSGMHMLVTVYLTTEQYSSCPTQSRNKVVDKSGVKKTPTCVLHVLPHFGRNRINTHWTM